MSDHRERPRGQPPLDIITPGMDAVRWVLLSRRIHERWLHWVEGRTFPCQGDGCEWCPNPPWGTDDAAELWSWGLRWKGYVGVVEHGRARVKILEMTACAWLECPDLEVLNVAGRLRGRILRVWRRKVGPHGRVAALLEPEPFLNLKALPPEPDVRAAVTRLWKEQPCKPNDDGAGAASGGD